MGFGGSLLRKVAPVLTGMLLLAAGAAGWHYVRPDPADLTGNFEAVADSVFLVRTDLDLAGHLEGVLQEGILQKLEPESKGKGTGFLIEGNYVVTNHHVVDSKGTYFTLVDRHGEEFETELVAADSIADVAVLKFKDAAEAEGRRPLRFAAADPQPGEPVFSIGNPLRFSFLLTAGIIAGRGDSNDKESRADDGFLIVDVLINKGNSGGPLFNRSNEVVGVSQAVHTGGGNVSAGYAYAVPAETAAWVVAELLESGEVWRPRIGFGISDIDEELIEWRPAAPAEYLGRVFVHSVTRGSKAFQAGIRAEDVILEVNGLAADTELVRSEIAALQRMQGIEFKVARPGPGGPQIFTVRTLAANRKGA